jgi:DNA-binding transcriptional MocR family regulator
VAYLVVPPSLSAPSSTPGGRWTTHGDPSQAVIADFLAEGHFAPTSAAHAGNLPRAAGRAGRPDRPGDGKAASGPAEGGSVVLYLAGDKATDFRRAAANGIDVTPLSRYTHGKGEPALVLGYSALTPDAIRAGVRGLAKLLRARPTVRSV